MNDSYLTVYEYKAAEIIEKKSKFIAAVFPISTEEEAIIFINETKKKHYNASHNVYAYRIGISNIIERQNDDGEPAQTAGLPILNVLRGKDITNALIVVTRYFGGTLLGTGGLVRAYTQAAQAGLNEAGVIEKITYAQIAIISDYNLSGKIQYAILQNEYVLHDTIYTDSVKFIVLSRQNKTEALIKLVTEITNAKAEIERCDDVSGFWNNDKLNINI